MVSPILSNIFLHDVRDEWFEREVQPRLKGRSFLIRFADDFVLGFSHEEDARRVKDVLPKRFEKYGLTLHPEKTRRVPFERPRGAPHEASPGTRTPPGTFDLLGFTHFWTRSRKGNWVVRRTTSKNRWSRGLKALAQWLREVRHEPLADQHRTLGQKLRGHFASYGITGNGDALNRFRRGAIELWRKWLSRRHRDGQMAWDRMYRLLERYPLPPAIVVHSVYRLAAKP